VFGSGIDIYDVKANSASRNNFQFFSGLDHRPGDVQGSQQYGVAVGNLFDHIAFRWQIAYLDSVTFLGQIIDPRP
jgi:hypothetical protein